MPPTPCESESKPRCARCLAVAPTVAAGTLTEDLRPADGFEETASDAVWTASSETGASLDAQAQAQEREAQARAEAERAVRVERERRARQVEAAQAKVVLLEQKEREADAALASARARLAEGRAELTEALESLKALGQ